MGTGGHGYSKRARRRGQHLADLRDELQYGICFGGARVPEPYAQHG